MLPHLNVALKIVRALLLSRRFLQSHHLHGLLRSSQLIGGVENRTVKTDKSSLGNLRSPWSLRVQTLSIFARPAPRRLQRRVNSYSLDFLLTNISVFVTILILKVFLYKMNFFVFTAVVLIAIQGGEWTCVCNVRALFFSRLEWSYTVLSISFKFFEENHVIANVV